MAKVILICGKICSGKSTYAERLRTENKAVVLSVDDIMLGIFGQYVGEKHDEYCENLQKYLFNKSLELIEVGVNVILDWGFWQKYEREFAKEFYKSRNIDCEFHYIEVSDEVWKQRIEKRNSSISDVAPNAYFVDDNLARKFGAIFECPGEDEIDVRVKSD
ncbi:MAG: ATP-binding protein [Oscillospiraceae bacterium]|nr:ATP-binding protein [Oscillospiraceae bacterium]